MKVGIMQPYFFPYIGYFQLMNAVDKFVVYDNIEYTKKGWINRNRILSGNTDTYITLPLKKDSDYCYVIQRSLSDGWQTERNKLLNKINETYRKAPCRHLVYPVLEHCLLYEDQNLFQFLLHSLEAIKEYLGISTTIIVSSTLDIDHNLKSEEKVIAICQTCNATSYYNPIGGLELYDSIRFQQSGIELKFLKTNNISYQQFKNDFIPMLSIIDVMMFNDKEQIKNYLTQYELN